MYRQLPVSNKICYQKNFERNMKLHKEHIQNLKPCVDQQPPKVLEFLQSKKKNPIKEQRQIEIDRENKILLDKITTIMQKHPLQRAQTTTNLNSQKIIFSKKSMNSELRKKELVQIVIENQGILKRIQERKSCYNIKQWKKERNQNEKYISNICEYQYKKFKPTKTQLKLGIWADQSSSKAITQLKGSKKKLEPISSSQESKIIYSKARKIGLYYYYAEIKVTKQIFSLSLDNLEKVNNKYFLEFAQKEGQDILERQCKNSIDEFMKRIQIDEEKKLIQFDKESPNVEEINSKRALPQQNLNEEKEESKLQCTEEEKEINIPPSSEQKQEKNPEQDNNGQQEDALSQQEIREEKQENTGSNDKAEESQEKVMEAGNNSKIELGSEENRREDNLEDKN